MATVLPPPSKRQKLALADKALREAEALTIPDDQGTVRIQFIDSSSGKSTGPPVAIAVKDATVKNLENLLNTLQSASADPDTAPDRVPYRFFFTPDTVQNAKDQVVSIDVLHSIYHSILSTGYLSTETTIPLHYTPQSVFRVRPVTRCSASIPGHASPILTCTFSPGAHSSSTLATGSGDNTARIFDTATGTPKHTLKGHTGWVLALSFSPGDGKILATGSMDNSVRLWDSSTGQALGGPMKGHTKWITSLVWEPVHSVQQGKPRLASSSKDCTVRVWDAGLRRVDAVLSGHKGSVTCVRWGGVGRVYTASQDKTIKVWNSRGWGCLFTLTAHAHWVNYLALSTDAVLKQGWWDADPRAKGAVPADTEGRKKRAKERFEAAARIDGVVTERLVSASDDNTLFLWEPSKFDVDSNATPKPVARMLGHQKQVNHVAFSPDGAWVASASFDNSVKLWDARDGKFVTTLRGHVGAVYMCAFSADSRLLVSCSKDTTVKVWDVRTGKLKEDLPGHKDEVYAVDWSGDGGAVASGGADKIVKVWKN